MCQFTRVNGVPVQQCYSGKVNGVPVQQCYSSVSAIIAAILSGNIATAETVQLDGINVEIPVSDAIVAAGSQA